MSDTISAVNALRLNKAALTLYVGMKWTVDGRKYEVIEIYPHFIRLQDRKGRIITMTKGEVVQRRTPKQTDKFKEGRRVKCLTDGKMYPSVAALADELEMNEGSVWVHVNEQKVLKGKVYYWAE